MNKCVYFLGAIYAIANMCMKMWSLLRPIDPIQPNRKPVFDALKVRFGMFTYLHFFRFDFLGECRNKLGIKLCDHNLLTLTKSLENLNYGLFRCIEDKVRTFFFSSKDIDMGATTFIELNPEPDVASVGFHPNRESFVRSKLP